MNNVIDFNSIKAKKDEEEFQEIYETHLKNISVAKYNVIETLEKLDLPDLDVAIALRVLVDGIVKYTEWDSKTFYDYADTFIKDSLEKKD